MPTILYATGNAAKFRQAQHVCQEFGIDLIQNRLDVPEIQSEDAEAITRDKATKGYAKLKKPLVVSDDTWSIPGLKGFPGPYMKYINDWFTVDDWLNLTRSLTDRRVFLCQTAVYQDANGQRVFTNTIEGILLTEPRGTSIYPHSYITSFDGGQSTNAEYHAREESITARLPNVWHDFAEWYSKHSA